MIELCYVCTAITIFRQWKVRSLINSTSVLFKSSKRLIVSHIVLKSSVIGRFTRFLPLLNWNRLHFSDQIHSSDPDQRTQIRFMLKGIPSAWNHTYSKRSSTGAKPRSAVLSTWWDGKNMGQSQTCGEIYQKWMMLWIWCAIMKKLWVVQCQEDISRNGDHCERLHHRRSLPHLWVRSNDRCRQSLHQGPRRQRLRSPERF